MEKTSFFDSEKQRNTASKYDFVKVKVWLSSAPSEDSHYYVMSRYLTCRMLTVTKIPHQKAVKIAMDLKKRLVDENLLNVAQEKMENILFSIMSDRGFGEEYIRCYKLVSRFFQQRRPLIVLICGIPFTGKSTIAQALASRFNMPNVLQTDVMNNLLRGSGDELLHPSPIWERDDLDGVQLIAEFQREARVVRKAVTGDLTKAVRDGKSVIIEGMHNDPGLYLYEFSQCGLSYLQDSPVWRSLAPKEPLPPLKHRLQVEDHESASVPTFKTMASFALTSSGPDGHPHITSAAELPSDQASEPIAIAGRSEGEAQGGSSMPIPSPGRLWLQFLGVAEKQDSSKVSLSQEANQPVHRHDDSYPGHLPTAKAWLSSKSRQFLGLTPMAKTPHPQQSSCTEPPAQQCEALPSSAAAPEANGNHKSEHRGNGEQGQLQGFNTDEQESAGEASDYGDDNSQGQLREATGGQDSAAEAPEEPPAVADHVSLESLDSFKVPSSVFTDAHAPPNGGMPLDRRKARFKHLGSLDRVKVQALKAYQAKTHSLSLPGSVHVSEQDGSSETEEDRETVRRGAINPRLDFQDHGSVSLAYSEHDQSDDSENTDVSAGHTTPADPELPSITKDHEPSTALPSAHPHPHPQPGPLGVSNAPCSAAQQPPDMGTEPAKSPPDKAQKNLLDRAPEKQKPDNLGPVFVPIVMTMDENDQAMLLQQRYFQHHSPEDLAKIRERMGVLQGYLTSYQARGIPVFSTSLSDMKATMNLLHGYLLECINIQMCQET